MDKKFEEYRDERDMSTSEALRTLIREGIEDDTEDDTESEDTPAQTGTADRLWKGAGLIGDLGMLALILAGLLWAVVEFGPVQLTLSTFLATAGVLLLSIFLITLSFGLTVVALALQRSDTSGSDRLLPDLRNAIASAIKHYGEST